MKEKPILLTQSTVNSLNDDEIPLIFDKLRAQVDNEDTPNGQSINNGDKKVSSTRYTPSYNTLPRNTRNSTATPRRSQEEYPQQCCVII